MDRQNITLKSEVADDFRNMVFLEKASNPEVRTQSDFLRMIMNFWKKNGTKGKTARRRT